MGLFLSLCNESCACVCVHTQCCRFHPNGNYIATGSCDRSVRMWDIVTGHCVRIFTGHKVRGREGNHSLIILLMDF